MEKSDIIFQLNHITQEFPGVKALDDVSFSVRRGRIHALVGENGAGKSTLIKVLAGINTHFQGEVFFNGQSFHPKNPNESQQMGISVVHQELKLAETLSVTENMFLGNLMYKGKLVDWKGMRKKAREMLQSLHVELDENALVDTLSVAQKQIVEICKAMNHNCQVLIMDEPSAVLTDRELDILFDVIIKELFGSKYCLEINDATLSKDITKDVPDKIFYCFNKISSDSIQDKQTKNLVEKIINDDMIELKNHDNFYFVGGRLITSEANNLPYKVLGEYKAFKINKNLEEDFRFLDPMTKVMRKYTRSELIKAIRLDLFNFSCEIRNFAPSINLAQVKNDIDINHTPSLQEDIEKFANEVADKQGEYLEKHILPFLENNYPDNFNDIKQLFEKHKMIERKYIRDFFMKKYNHIVSAKELYKELLASNNCYAKVTAPGGKKCFLFNK